MTASRWNPAAWTAAKSLQSWRMSATLSGTAGYTFRFSGAELIQIKERSVPAVYY